MAEYTFHLPTLWLIAIKMTSTLQVKDLVLVTSIIKKVPNNQLVLKHSTVHKLCFLMPQEKFIFAVLKLLAKYIWFSSKPKLALILNLNNKAFPPFHPLCAIFCVCWSLQHHESPTPWARELFKAFTDSQVFYRRLKKKIVLCLGFSVGEFIMGHVFANFWPTCPGCWRQHNELVKCFLESLLLSGF